MGRIIPTMGEGDFGKLKDLLNMELRAGTGIRIYRYGPAITIQLDDYRKRYPAGEESSGIGFKVCKVTAVNSDHFECKDIDSQTGAVIGDAFEVWPVVYEGGITASYDLSIESGDGMVHPKLRAGARLRVCTGSQSESIVDGTPAEPRIYSFDAFYVTCGAGG